VLCVKYEEIHTDINYIIKNARESLWSGTHSAYPVDRASSFPATVPGIQIWRYIWNDTTMLAPNFFWKRGYMIVDISFHMPNCAQGKENNKFQHINTSVLQISSIGVRIRAKVKEVKDCTKMNSLITRKKLPIVSWKPVCKDERTHTRTHTHIHHSAHVCMWMCSLKNNADSSFGPSCISNPATSIL